MKAYAVQRGIADIEDQFEKFSAYHAAKGSTFKDWHSAWRNWVLRAVEYQGRNNGSGSLERAVEKAFEE
jgi:hypothetical protein